MEKYKDKNLPEKEHFYSSLTGKHITSDEYEFAKKVFGILNCQNLGDYNDHYLELMFFSWLTFLKIFVIHVLKCIK